MNLRFIIAGSRRLGLPAALCFSVIVPLQAQNFAINWFTIDDGGGTSTAGVYSVSGTIGQPYAGVPMNNGPCSLLGGLWALPILVQTPGAPTLYITNAAPGFATIWWARLTDKDSQLAVQCEQIRALEERLKSSEQLVSKLAETR